MSAVRFAREAVDLLEGVLRQAAQSFEERKVALLARLYSEVAHDPSVDAASAAFAVRLVGELTYRQLVILSTLALEDRHHHATVQAAGRLYCPDELDDLGDRGLIGLVSPEGVVRPPGRMHGAMTFDNLKGMPATISDAGGHHVDLTRYGERLVRLTAATETIPDSERDAFLTQEGEQP